MGMTLRAGKPDPYEVRKEVDNYENTSLFDNMLINGKSVASRKQRRERRREQAQQKKQLDLQKSSDMTKKSPKLANNSQNMKQAAWIKIAQVKLAINYVLRNRGRSKSAAGIGGFMQGFAPMVQQGFNRFGQSMGNMASNVRQGFQNNVRSGINTAVNSNMATNAANTFQQMRPPAFTSPVQAPMFQSRNPISGDQFNQLSNPRDFKTLRGIVGPAVRNNDGSKAWDSSSDTYNFAEGDWDSYQRERDRIESGWNQLDDAEKEKYKRSYDRHIAALDRWKATQDYRDENPLSESYDAPGTLPGIAENPGGGGWQPASGSRPFDPGVPSLEPVEYDSAGEIPGDYDAMRNEFFRSAPAGEAYSYGPNVGAPRNPQADIQRGAIRRPGLG